VRAIKYGGWRHLADICAEKMADEIRRRGCRLDLLVPVPLHPLRYREQAMGRIREVPLLVNSLDNKLLCSY